MIILNLCGAYLNFGTLFILCGFLVVTGAIETIGFLYFGTNVLRILRQSSRAMNQKKSGLERRLTIFVLCCIIFWTFSFIFAGAGFLIDDIDPTPSGLFIFSVLRDIIICLLFVTLMAVMYGADRKLSTSSVQQQQTSGDPELSQEQDRKITSSPETLPPTHHLDEFIRNTKEVDM